MKSDKKKLEEIEKTLKLILKELKKVNKKIDNVYMMQALK